MKMTARIILIGAGIPALLYILVCANLFVFQRSLIYYPQPRSNSLASTLMTIPVADGIVHVSAHPLAGPAAIIYFGGNAEDVSQDIADLNKTFPSRAVYALHYPGFGGSSGSPSQQTIFADSLILFDRVHAEHSDAIVVGRSLGSGVAVWVASQRAASQLILVTPFDSLADVAGRQYPFLPVRFLLRDKFDTWKYAVKVTAPTRIIVAGQDELIPRSSSDRLRGRFHKGLATYVVLPGVGHNDIQTHPRYWETLKGN